MTPIRVVHKERIPWPVFVMVALCLTAGPSIFFAWNRQWTRVLPGTPGWEPNAALAAKTASLRQSEAAGRPLTDVLTILYGNARGRRVQLDGVAVRAVSGPGSFWVNQLGTEPVLVRAREETVQPNRRVNLTGTVRVGGDRRAYIEADKIEVTGWY